jgi:hypothetical protein
VHENPVVNHVVNEIFTRIKIILKFFEDLLRLPQGRKVDHAIRLILRDALISYVFYHHFLLENNELKNPNKIRLSNRVYPTQ